MQRLPQGNAHEFHYHPKTAASVKAELIRRNLLSRKDLMQLYRPPLKKSEIPQNNPFTNKSMVEPRAVTAGQPSKRSSQNLPMIHNVTQNLVGRAQTRA